MNEIPPRVCQTCEHWAPYLKPEYLVDELMLRDPETLDVLHPQPYLLGRCSSPKIRELERPEEDGAAVLDGSMYTAKLITAPQFGCIHHRRLYPRQSPPPTD